MGVAPKDISLTWHTKGSHLLQLVNQPPALFLDEVGSSRADVWRAQGSRLRRDSKRTDRCHICNDDRRPARRADLRPRLADRRRRDRRRQGNHARRRAHGRLHDPPAARGRSVGRVSLFSARALSWRRAAADETTRNNSKRNDAKRSKNNTQLISPRPFVRSRRARLAIVASPPCPAIVTPPFHVSSFLSCWRVAASLCVRSGLRSARARTGTRGLPA